MINAISAARLKVIEVTEFKNTIVHGSEALPVNVLLLPSVLRLEIPDLSHPANRDLEVWTEVVELFIKTEESS